VACRRNCAFAETQQKEEAIAGTDSSFSLSYCSIFARFLFLSVANLLLVNYRLRVKNRGFVGDFDVDGDDAAKRRQNSLRENLKVGSVFSIAEVGIASLILWFELSEFGFRL
jgi:hypothetical protein